VQLASPIRELRHHLPPLIASSGCSRRNFGLEVVDGSNRTCRSARANVGTMTRLRPGWLVALFAAILSVSAFLPWLTTTVNGGGWANAIGGSIGSLDLPPGFGLGQLIVLLSSTLLVAGAMVGRGLSARLASVAALVISLLIATLTVWYYNINVKPPVSAAYGLYIGAASAVGAVCCSVWALISSLVAARSLR